MRRTTTWVAALALCLSGLALSGAAEAKPKVDFAKVDVPASPEAARVEKAFKQALAKAAKKANFGKGKHVALSARVLELTREEHGDVLRITCTAMGRVVGGPGAKSRISFGGDPAHRDELENQVLTMVANGLVGRLAQIARAASAAPPPVEAVPAPRR